MKKLLLAGLAGAVLAPIAPAQAHPTYHYAGGCGYFAVSDGTSTGQTKWDGEVHVAAIATDAITGATATVDITVECELRINGGFPGIVVLSASGTTAAVGVREFSFHAHPADIVTMCRIVTVGGEHHKDCDVSAPSPVQTVELTIDNMRRIIGLGAVFGRIVIADNGGGTVWQAMGELAVPTRWTCDLTAGDVAVECSWVGTPLQPACGWVSALAVSLPPAAGTVAWGSAETWATCFGGVPTTVPSGTATGTTPVGFSAEPTMTNNVTKVRCYVHDGWLAVPQPRYLAECGFMF